MQNLNTILATLKSKAHCILPMYATSLAENIEKYLAGEIKIEANPAADLVVNQYAVSEDGIAVFDIEGVIMKRVGLPKHILDFFGIVDLDNVDALLKTVKDDASIKALVLNVNSPGGFITGVASTANLIKEVSEAKNVVVYSDVLNASAAYWLSSQADTIVTSVDAELGSIGVYTTYYDLSAYYASLGVNVRVFKAGKYKAIGAENTALSEEQAKFIQDDIDATWAQFKSTVNSKRNVAEEDMQGQTFSGVVAVEKGLADAVASNLEEILAILSETAE